MNRLKQFKHINRKNNKNIIKMGEIRVKGYQGRCKPKTKVRIIIEDMRACEIYKNMITDIKEWKQWQT